MTGLLLDSTGAARSTEDRSPHWSAVVKVHLHYEPTCQVCGGKDHLQVHHIQTFHLHPELELEPTNLITLCEPHHLLVGHLMLWASWNPTVRADAQLWWGKIKDRPAGRS